MNQRGFIFPPVATMLGVFCAALLATVFALYQLWRGAQNDFAEFRAAVALAQEQAAAEAARLQAEQERINRATVEGWVAAVDWYRQYPRIVRVREPASCASPVPTVSNSASAPDGGAVDQGVDPIALTAYECEQKLNDAILDAAQLMWLQAWIKAQGSAPSGISSTLIGKSGEPDGAPIEGSYNAE